MNTEKTYQLFKTDLSKFDNSWYKHPSIIIRVLWILMSNVFINTYLPVPISLKVIILKMFGAKIGQGVMIKSGVNIKYPWLLSIGNFVWIGEEVWIDNLIDVKISNNVCISQGAMLLTGNHNYKETTFGLIIGEIILEDGVWIGAKSVVCPGTTCKSHAVLAVGSVATSDLEPYSIYQGNPAQWVRTRRIEEK